ncbi:MAG: SUMF1/EgtB/PvdO family nonheme iron enzyme [Rhizobiaceae bacterium]|nr:SUMF1/EgtB/PvdO family nonheme iron enzyme [Rhizobiaceae bacterium]
MHSIFKAKTAAILSVLYLATTAIAVSQDVSLPELVTVSSGMHQYRASGEFLRSGVPADAPVLAISMPRSFDIMKYQVSVEAYRSCVSEGACGEALANRSQKPDHPVTGISFTNALEYARWLSAKTNVKWRLPTDEEWSYAAGSRFVDDSLGAREDPENPALRWLLKYQKYADLESEQTLPVKPHGDFGANENGIYDMSGNVWEWTQTCYQRSSIDLDGKVRADGTANCGVRIAEGQHRAYITYFVQDAKGGGCSVGAPPTHLGFRLVRDDKAGTALGLINRWWDSLLGKD